MGGRGTARRPRRRDSGSRHLNDETIALRRLEDTPADVEVGHAIVREYVVATAEEQTEPGQPSVLEAILPHIPDWDDFAGRFLHSGGAFVVATVDDALAGCVGVTPLDDRVCEMNRLWVRPQYRAFGLGRRLAPASMDESRALGFTAHAARRAAEAHWRDRALPLDGLRRRATVARVCVPDGVPGPRSVTIRNAESAR